MGVINFITQMKLKEFRMEKGIYYVPEDFHTNPKYKVYDQLIKTKPVDDTKFNSIIKVLLIGITSIGSSYAKHVLPDQTVLIDSINSGVNDTLKTL